MAGQQAPWTLSNHFLVVQAVGWQWWNLLLLVWKLVSFWETLWFSWGYGFSVLSYSQGIDAFWEEVWFSGGIPKHKFLTWLMIRNRCPSEDRLLAWGLQTDPLCLFCNSVPESIVHCFFECSFTWPIWKVIADKCRFQTMRQWNSLLEQLSTTRLSKHQQPLLLLGRQLSTPYGQSETTVFTELTSPLLMAFKRRSSSLSKTESQVSDWTGHCSPLR